MAKIERVWLEEDFSSISIDGHDCQAEIQGYAGNQAELSGEFSDHRDQDLKMDCSDRHLSIHARQAQFKLKLPGSKYWLISILGGRGGVKVSDIQSGLRIMLGKGDVRLEKCRGWLRIGAGQGDIEVRNFVQMDTGRPDFPVSFHHQSGDDCPHPPWDWVSGREPDFEGWGYDLAEKIGGWAMDLGRFSDRSKIDEKDIGVNLQTGNGNLKVEDIEANAVLFRSGRGNLKLEKAQVMNLVASLACGNIECSSIVPAGDWNLKTARGNIQISLPVNIGVRLDMATRQGNIDSEIPLVRVTHQGPETYSGRRMVGTTGTGDGMFPALQITALRGNIKIQSGPAVSPSAAAPVIDQVPSPSPTGCPAPGPSADRSRASAVTTKEENPLVGNTRLGILKALQDGQISVDEADRLLRSPGP
jgi:hypothetical protein